MLSRASLQSIDEDYFYQNFKLRQPLKFRAFWFRLCQVAPSSLSAGAFELRNPHSPFRIPCAPAFNKCPPSFLGVLTTVQMLRE